MESSTVDHGPMMDRGVVDHGPMMDRGVMDHGPSTVHCRPWTMESWTVDHGVVETVVDSWTLDHGPWSRGPWTMDRGPWSVDR